MYTFLYASGKALFAYKKSAGWSRAKRYDNVIVLQQYSGITQREHVYLKHRTIYKTTLCFHAHNVVHTVNNFRSFGFMFKSREVVVPGLQRT